MSRIGHFEALEKLLDPDPQRGAEIGVYRGDLSIWLLEKYRNLHLTLVDRWTPPEPNDSWATYESEALIALTADQHEENLERLKWFMKVAPERNTILRMDFRDAAKHVEDDSLDFIYLDADHSKQGTLAAIECWAPKVRSGGVVGGHDWSYVFVGVQEAILEYTGARGISPEAITIIRGTWGYIQP